MTTEIERALAVLSLDHSLVSAETALSMIKVSRQGTRPLHTQIREAVPEVDLLRAVAAELGMPFHDLLARDTEVRMDEPLVRECNLRVLTEHAALPMRDAVGGIVVVMANPLDADINNYFRTRFTDGYRAAISPRGQILARLLTVASEFNFDAAGGNVVVPWVDHLFERAVAEGASDVHLGFLHNGQLMLRFRVDGVLRQIQFPDQLSGREHEVVAALLAKCSTIDPTNTREPQDGKFSLMVAGRPIDFRVNMLPQVTGPKVTVRILDPSSLQKRPEEMGFSKENLRVMREALGASQGCIVVAGPTGSGKTTTLYSLLREVDALSKHVLTVEDPVEYRLNYIGQTQIREDLGERSLTWARALRAIVRQDPDVILVGEIRDPAVAKTAMEASITGHLVLTTVHANNAPGVYLRLIEMGVERFMVSEAVSLIVSQRLLRRVHDCMTWGPPSPEEELLFAKWGVPKLDRVPKAQGCPGCNGTGYRGRMAVVETLVPTLRLRSAIGSAQSKDVLIKEAVAAGWKPIIHDGLRAVDQGGTTVLELARALVTEEDDTMPAETPASEPGEVNG